MRKLGFVQADPMRAPARAQDLILFQRVNGSRAGDLERRYERLGLEEDAFVNYGFVPRGTLALLHPRTPRRPWDAATLGRAQEVLDFVRARGVVHPREVNEAFAHHGRVAGYWGGELNASTRLLDAMQAEGDVQKRAARLALLEEQRDSASDARIRRMKESQIETARRDYERRADELKIAPGQADVISEAVAGGVVTVEAEK